MSPPGTEGTTTLLVATSQQSRFHTEAGDTASIASKDVSSSFTYIDIITTRHEITARYPQSRPHNRQSGDPQWCRSEAAAWRALCGRWEEWCGEIELRIDCHFASLCVGLIDFVALLRAIGEKHIAAIPQNLRILLMGQSIGAEKVSVQADKETVLQHVIRSDMERERALREAKRKCSGFTSNIPSNPCCLSPVSCFGELCGSVGCCYGVADVET